METSKSTNGIAAGLALGLAVAVLGSITMGCETYGHNSSLNANSVAAKGSGTWEATPRNAGAGTTGTSLAAGANPNMQRTSEGQYAGAAGASTTPAGGTGSSAGMTTATGTTAGSTPVAAPGTQPAGAGGQAPQSSTVAAPGKAGGAPAAPAAPGRRP